MSQRRPKYVHRVRSKGKDYYYAWRGGPRIHANPYTPEWYVEYGRLMRGRKPGPDIGTVSELIRLYCQSPRWRSLRETTRATYLHALDRIEAEFSDLPLRFFTDKGARRTFLDWRDEIAVKTPRMADLTMSLMQAMVGYALDRNLVDANPLEKIAKVHDGTRRDVIWTDDQISRFKASAPPHLARAMMLALWTGQRQGDLLRLTWSGYDGKAISLRQGKTGRMVRVAAAEDLRLILDSVERAAVTILTTEDGRPWRSGFKSSWRKAVVAAGIENPPTFHDLRGTFVTMAYRNGASIKDIADVTGHSEADAERIIRHHYLVAEAAVLAIESGTKRGKNVKLPRDRKTRGGPPSRKAS